MRRGRRRYRACGRFEEGAARARSRPADWAELIESGAAQRSKKAGDAAPSFSLEGPEGNVVNSADLPKRLRHGLPLNRYDRSTFYGGDARGYIDYPAAEFASVA